MRTLRGEEGQMEEEAHRWPHEEHRLCVRYVPPTTSTAFSIRVQLQIANFSDPDGYWIEVVQNEKLKTRANW